MGPVHVTLDPAHKTLGQIEEKANNTPGILDVPPFTPAGTADSFFDVYYLIQVGDRVFHPAKPVHMTSVIHHKPPAPGDDYVNPFTEPVDLLDANGQPTGIKIIKEVHTPNPPKEIDVFPGSLAQITLTKPDGSSEVVSLSGPSTVEVLIGLNGQAFDSDGDGLDQVSTEMTQLDLKGTSSMGPVRVNLDPSHKTVGEIEEKVNNTPGILDVPPFAATGTADSFFDVYFEIHVGDRVFHPAKPVHMASVIHHKPPGPGDDYVNPFTEPVDLLDANGQPTGIKIIKEVHTPVPPKEVDIFPVSLAQITLAKPDGSTELVNLAGPATVEVTIGSNGEASDTDADGLDQVSTEMTQLALKGASSLGPVLVTLDPNKKTFGQIEEKVNNTPGILDVPPFAATGTADSFFDVNFLIHVGDAVFHTANPVHMTSVIHHKPPGPGDDYVNPFTEPVELLDASGKPTGIKIIKEVHTPNPPHEIDAFPVSLAQITLATPNGGTEVVRLSGPSTVEVAIGLNGQAGDSDGDGLDQVETEMTQLDLKGTSSMGPVQVTLDPNHKTLGQIEEKVNNTPGILDVPPFASTGTADSFFDVFFLIRVGDRVFHPAKPVHMASVIHHKPPAPGDDYVNPFTEPVDLLDANGQPTGIKIVKEVHTPNPPREIDVFPISQAQITLAAPNGGTEVVNLSGPSTVEVLIGLNGEGGDSDGDGLDQVPTEMTQLDLKGTSSMGPVHVTLDPAHKTLGEIEEKANNTPGILDVPPFAAAGTANSFFDVYFQIQVGDKVLHPARPVHMTSVIDHKPPGPGTSYVNPFTEPVELLDANGQPTGIKIIREVHTPNPPIEIDDFPISLAQITITKPDGNNETVNLSGPSTVQVLIGLNGQAGDSDGDGLDQAPTEMTKLELKGVSSFGPVLVTLDPAHKTLGQIEEKVNNTPGILDIPPFAATGTADSYFDVYYLIKVGNNVFHPATPVHMTSVIHHKPPAPGDDYVNPFTEPVELLDASGKPTGIKIIREVHTPNPPHEIDIFPNSVAMITLATPNGNEVIKLTGPSTVDVLIGLNGQAGDSDGDGLDQVPTEMTQLELKGTSSMGPVRVTLDPNHKTLGQIEEKVNNTPGILDVPPFTAAGTADSYFDVYYLIQVGDRVFHPAKAVHMTSVIHHKPPAPGDDYVNPFTEPVDLLDANGQPTGIKIVKEVHTPNPSQEIDVFPITLAQITIACDIGPTETVNLSGPSTVVVAIGPNGEATDLDGDGLDQVNTEMTQLDLKGMSSLGPVHVRLDPSRASLGQIEEDANNTPGILDVPPFAAKGTAHSYFDVYYLIEVGGKVLHPAQPVRMEAVITHKPPGPGDTYVNPFTQPVELLDANGNPTGFKIIKEVHTPNPPKEIDLFPVSLAQITVALPDGKQEVVNLSGPSTVEVLIGLNGQAGDSDGDGLDQVPTEMTQLDLKGTSSAGPVHVTLDPAHKTLGQIEEKVNNTPGILDIPPFAAAGTADSYFDVYYLIQVGNNVLHPANPVHMTSVIHHKPPGPGDDYVNPFTEPVELLDASGKPTGIKILKEVHTPNPPREIDEFPVSSAQITLAMPDGTSEVVNLAGPSTVEVQIPPTGQAGDIDGDGLDQVLTEMTQLELKGTSSFGPVLVTLDPIHKTVGQIEEKVNNTPGILDVPPFAAAGTADSYFDVYYEIHVGGHVFHPRTPVHMASVITHKPPGPGDTYVNPFDQPVELLDENGNPTGIKILKEVHTPNPPKEVDVFPVSLAQITVALPDGKLETIQLAGPSTVEVAIPPSGAASDTDGDGLDQVSTEMTQLDLKGVSSMGPVRVMLDPAHPTLGEIEEQANNTPGILDVPPFASTGKANSFFDVYYLIQVGDKVYHAAQAVHMAAIITHKPPAPGDTYVNPFTIPVDLLDADGRPTGIKIVREVHTPNPPKEIDIFPVSFAQITLALPNGGTETVSLAGPTTVEVGVPPTGQATDTDGDGLDQVATEMTQLDLRGTSSLGPVRVSLDPSRKTLGEIEEQVNNTPGILDVPPFAGTGKANSFFNVFYLIEVGGKVYHTADSARMEAVITHKPPAPGDTYTNPFTQPIELLDANGKPTGIKIVREVHTPNPPKEVDVFPLSVAQITIANAAGATEVVNLSGPTTVEVTIAPNGATLDSDGDGLDDAASQMTLLDLKGTSSRGPVHVTLDPNRPTLGQIEETANNTPGILDIPPFASSGRAVSYFNVFYIIQIGDQVFHPEKPIHMETVISHKPPGPGDTYVNPFTEPVELLDANGKPTGIRIVKEVHTPNPPKEIDDFPGSLALVTFILPNGQTEIVRMAGPTTVVVDIPPNGQASDQNGNGLDEVKSEMTVLNMKGKSSQGDIIIRLAGQALGQIEEAANNTPGILDVPPFTRTGTAKSFFDIPLEIVLGGQTFKVAKPIRMESTISHKPPGPQDRYINPAGDPIDVLDASGKPTGFKIARAIDIPNPRIVPVPVVGRKLEIHYPAADTGVVLQQATSLLGPWTDVPGGTDNGAERTLVVDTQAGDPHVFYRYVLKQ
jgi:hypothetical protein